MALFLMQYWVMGIVTVKGTQWAQQLSWINDKLFAHLLLLCVWGISPCTVMYFLVPFGFSCSFMHCFNSGNLLLALCYYLLQVLLVKIITCNKALLQCRKTEMLIVLFFSCKGHFLKLEVIALNFCLSIFALKMPKKWAVVALLRLSKSPIKWKILAFSNSHCGKILLSFNTMDDADHITNFHQKILEYHFLFGWQ